jgi:hypothetical protein
VSTLQKDVCDLLLLAKEQEQEEEEGKADDVFVVVVARVAIWFASATIGLLYLCSNCDSNSD